MATHVDARARLNLLYHVYFLVDQELLDPEDSPPDAVQDAYADEPELSDWFVTRWYEEHDDRFDWRDTVVALVEDEL